MFSKIKELLFGKVYEWKYTSTSVEYDLTRHPEVSKDSPIKSFSMTYLYRYCPKYKVLQKKNIYMTRSNYLDVNINMTKAYSPEIENFIKVSDIAYNRESKISKLVKK